MGPVGAKFRLRPLIKNVGKFVMTLVKFYGPVFSYPSPQKNVAIVVTRIVLFQFNSQEVKYAHIFTKTCMQNLPTYSIVRFDLILIS